MISIAQQTNGREWVVLASKQNTSNRGYFTNQTSQAKLLFNEAVPANSRNRATAVGPPAAIVIEKLLHLPPEEQLKDTDGSVKSSLSFSNLSEKKLQAAVDLAKRDLRRSRFQAMCRLSAEPLGDSFVSDICSTTLPQTPSKKRPVPSKQKGRLATSARPVAGTDQYDLFRKEVRNLQNELKNLKKGLTPDLNLLGARQPQYMAKKATTTSVLHIHRPPLDALDQQDLRRQEIFKLQNNSDSAFVQDGTTNCSKASSPKKNTDNPSKKRLVASKSSWMQVPVSKAPGPMGQQDLLDREMQKLDAELENYMRQVEKLSDRDMACNNEQEEEELEPDEQEKAEVRWQKQSASLARTIYALQQQMKSIQQYIENLHNQGVWDDKKSTAIQRLAGAHRSTLKALQVVTRQLANQFHNKLPSYCGELSRLLCQLSLCSAKIQVDPGSPMPETAVDILRKLEILDHIISQHETRQAMQDQACPSQKKSTYPRMLPASRSSVPRGLPKATKPPRSSHASRMAAQKLRRPDRPFRPVNLQRAPQQLKRNSPGEKKQQATKVKVNLGKEATHFKEPTVASRLRVNQPPSRETSVPWIPASSHSLSPSRSGHKTTQEPRCLSSPAKLTSSSSPQKVPVRFSEEGQPSSDNKRQAQNEALRGAWLDKITTQRLKDLNELTREEAERIQRLRDEVVSPTQWAERAEQQMRERIKPLLDEAKHLGESRSRSNSSLRNKLSEQAATNVAEKGEEADLLDEAALRFVQAPTLEVMLQRMEEIQRDQEQVRRRVASIAYSDTLQWEQPAGSQFQVASSRPSSPQPIRLTKPVLRQPPLADIVLEEPVETGVLSDSSLVDSASQKDGLPVFPGPKESGPARTVISVPGSMLKSIRHYREDYDSHMSHAAHEGRSGDVHFWSIADSLADELLGDAVGGVAAEFQDVMEECAEAVFTAEFLQLIHSPRLTASSSSSVNQ
ncbi:protein moonraker isoform X2 [Syngnathus typhle]|uniref:protein moonraker isoform X2 n=1 Tax=Syngnathus typhle TaxID=161592 RepID=UPI002A6A565B|nr:protein moonraker isoform X2 [Syngnathus typhle]